MLTIKVDRRMPIEKLKPIFIDRDGVINVFPGNGNYVTKVKDFVFLPRSLDAMQMLTEEGYIIFVISNQAGVGRGFFSKDKLKRITHKMIEGVRKRGIRLKGVHYCTHRSDEGCGCRKPEIGSIRNALKSINRNMRAIKDSYFIGDTKSDMLTGFRAGCKTILVLSGRAKKWQIKDWGVRPDYIVRDLFEAAQIITGRREIKKYMTVRKRAQKTLEQYK